MVSVSPRASFLDSDDEPEPGSTDPRFAFGFGSMSLTDDRYSEHEPDDYHRPLTGFSDHGHRRKQRSRQSSSLLNSACPFTYETEADGHAFRLVILHPGTGTSTIQCDLVLESTKNVRRVYNCLSYAWGSINRNNAILLNGRRFAVTSNLYSALQALRKPKTPVTIWIDMICIDQDNTGERGHQVSIMKTIFNQATKIYVWLGEDDDRSERLCAFAKSMRRGSDESAKTNLNRILSQRELRDAIRNLLQRPWFQRVWVIQEVALARRITVACGRAHMTWPELVRLIRDVKWPENPGFDKKASLLGNPRQRIAILTQMIAGQKEALAHTDITQLLILSKSSQATDSRDMVYAFHGLTLLTTVPNYSAPLDHSDPDYQRALKRLYIDTAEQYINSIRWEPSYSNWHKLDDGQKTFQLMSIIYSAGVLHRHLELPSWVPDWTFAWHLAPVFAKTIPNFLPATGRDEWSKGIRSEYRAGGDQMDIFELSKHQLHLRISALLVDTIVLVNEITPAPTPNESQVLSTSPISRFENEDVTNLSYGRHFFTTEQGYIGFTTPGTIESDEVAILVGGDVPVVLRRVTDKSGGSTDTFMVLCECYVQSPAVMHGDYLKQNRADAIEITIV